MTKKSVSEILAEVITNADPELLTRVNAQMDASFAVLTIAIEVRKARRAAGLTQTQLALKTGITQAEISRIEQGRYSPRLATLYTIARELKTDFVISGTLEVAPLVA
jgi:DNA-binding XRE family transcriptional regulator